MGTRTIALIVILNFEGNGPPLGYKPKWPRVSFANLIVNSPGLPARLQR